METQSAPLVIGMLRLSTDRLEELQDGRPILSVKRSDIEDVQLRYGLLARHPVLQILFALILIIGTGIFFLFGVVMAGEGKIMLLPWFAGVFVLLGLWLIYDATKRGWFLDIRSRDRRLRLVVARQLSPADQESLSRIVALPHTP